MTRSSLATARPSSPVPRISRASGSLRVGPPASEPPPRRRGQSLTPVWWVVACLLAGTLAGAGYYFAPMAERVRSPLHPWLGPSGYVGQTAGILSLSIFLFLWLYPFRKKFRWLAWTGTMAQWLDVHVAAALVLPGLAAMHASWRFEGLIGLGFLSMMVVVLSGVAGRYLYVRIPRGTTGLELSAEEVGAQRRSLMADLARQTGLPEAQVESILHLDPTPCEGLGLFGTLRQMIRDDRARWRASRALRRVCAAQSSGRRVDRQALRTVVKLAGREMSLTQQARMLGATQRVFRFWHVAHRPFAITALVAVLVHVGVVVAMGATWFW